MPQQADDGGSRSRAPWLLGLAVIAVVIVGLAGYVAAHALHRNDCTAVMSTMPDGSKIKITTCS